MNRIGQTPQNFQYCLREYGDWLPSDRLDTMTLALNWIEYLGSLELLVTGLIHSRPVPNPKRLDWPISLHNWYNRTTLSLVLSVYFATDRLIDLSMIIITNNQYIFLHRPTVFQDCMDDKKYWWHQVWVEIYLPWKTNYGILLLWNISCGVVNSAHCCSTPNNFELSSYLLALMTGGSLILWIDESDIKAIILTCSWCDEFCHFVLCLKSYTPVLCQWTAPPYRLTIVNEEMMFWCKCLFWINLKQ